MLAVNPESVRVICSVVVISVLFLYTIYAIASVTGDHEILALVCVIFDDERGVDFIVPEVSIVIMRLPDGPEVAPVVGLICLATNVWIPSEREVFIVINAVLAIQDPVPTNRALS